MCTDIYIISLWRQLHPTLRGQYVLPSRGPFRLFPPWYTVVPAPSKRMPRYCREADEMYVRWKRRVRAHKPKRVGYWTRDPAPPHVTRAAQLVEMRRINGQPRQRVVAHLATIDEATMVSFETRRAF